jgi:Tol biopolymer transport system component
MSLLPVPSDQPLSQPGSYLLDVTTGELWRGPRGVWSPDGRALAFGMCCIGNGFMDILEIGTGRSVRVQTGDVRDLAWSPDGQRIAYTAAEGGRPRAVHVVDRDGGLPRLVAEQADITQLRWLDDDRLAFASTLPDREHSYHLASLSTEVVEALEIRDPPVALDPRIVFGTPSPDGELVIFLKGPTPQASYLWQRSTGEVRKLSDNRLAVNWSPEGQRLLTAFAPEEGPLPLFGVIDLASGLEMELPDVGLWAQWLPDGERIVHGGFRCLPGGASSGPRDVFAINYDGTGARNLTNTPDVPEYEVNASPQGALVAFVELSGQASGSTEWRLNVMDVDRGEVQLVIRAPGVDLHVHGQAWSADGRYLRFHAAGGHGICT